MLFVGKKVPPAQELIKYDVVVLSHKKFSNETKLNFTDALSAPPSPLTQVHWLRLIIDEGHILGASNTSILISSIILYKLLLFTDIAALSQSLQVERLWLCSGTPTPATVVDAELSKIYGMMSFLRYPGLSQRKVWSAVISKPFKAYVW